MGKTAWKICLAGALLLPLGAGCKKATSEKKADPIKPPIKFSVAVIPGPCTPKPLGKQARKLVGAWTVDAERVIKQNAQWRQLRGDKRAKVLQGLGQMTLTITPRWMEMKGPRKTERSCWEVRSETSSTVTLQMTDAKGKAEALIITWEGSDAIRSQSADRHFYFKRKAPKQ